MYVLVSYKLLRKMDLITPQIAIGLLLISIGVVSKFDIKIDFLKEKE